MPDLGGRHDGADLPLFVSLVPLLLVCVSLTLSYNHIVIISIIIIIIIVIIIIIIIIRTTISIDIIIIIIISSSIIYHSADVEHDGHDDADPPQRLIRDQLLLLLLIIMMTNINMIITTLIMTMPTHPSASSRASPFQLARDMARVKAGGVKGSVLFDTVYFYPQLCTTHVPPLVEYDVL